MIDTIDIIDRCSAWCSLGDFEQYFEYIPEKSWIKQNLNDSSFTCQSSFKAKPGYKIALDKYIKKGWNPVEPSQFKSPDSKRLFFQLNPNLLIIENKIDGIQGINGEIIEINGES